MPPPRSFHYDTLVIAIGQYHQRLRDAGRCRACDPAETAEQAVRFNRRLVNACIHAHAQAAPVRPGQLHVAIIGAGATSTGSWSASTREVVEIVSIGWTPNATSGLS